jgi:hypothetical protein
MTSTPEKKNGRATGIEILANDLGFRSALFCQRFDIILPAPDTENKSKTVLQFDFSKTRPGPQAG